VLDRAALVRSLELRVGLLLGLEIDSARRNLGIGLQRSADLIFLGLDDILPGGTLVAARVPCTKEDRNLDLVVPPALHEVHLLAREQASAKQGQRHPHRHNDRQGHREVLSKPGAGLGQDMAETHQISPITRLAALAASRGTLRPRLGTLFGNTEITGSRTRLCSGLERLHHRRARSPAYASGRRWLSRASP